MSVEYKAQKFIMWS